MTHTRKHSRTGLFVNTALVALAFGLLAWVIWHNVGEIRKVFSHTLDLRLLALAFAIYLVGLFGTFVRWSFLVRAIEPKFRFSSSLILGSIGMVFNLVIPGAVGGDLIKAAYLVRMRIRRTQAIASMVIDRILGLLALFVLAAIAGGFAWGMATDDVKKLIVLDWAAVLAGVLVLAVIFSQVLTRFFPQLRRGRSRMSLIVAELREMSTTYRNRLDVIFGCGVLSVFIHGLNVLAFYLVGRMIYPDTVPTLANHYLMVPLTLVSMAVPIPFGALGVSEEVGKQLFELVGHPGGALAMMGFRILMYGGGTLCACVYLWKLKEVRELASAAEELEDKELAVETGY
jgi:glycosyltransferase 2 family protein